MEMNGLFFFLLHINNRIAGKIIHNSVSKQLWKNYIYKYISYIYYTNYTDLQMDIVREAVDFRDATDNLHTND